MWQKPPLLIQLCGLAIGKEKGVNFQGKGDTLFNITIFVDYSFLISIISFKGAPFREECDILVSKGLGCYLA